MLMTDEFRNLAYDLSSRNALSSFLVNMTSYLNSYDVVFKRGAVALDYKDGQLSYIPTDDKLTPVQLDNEWRQVRWSTRQDTFYRNHPKRVHGKPASVLRRILPQIALEMLHDKDFEEFAVMLQAHENRFKGEFVIVEGQDIVKWYLGNNYANDVNIGTLAHSCMRYDSCEPLIEFYAQLEGTVRMLIYKRADDKIIGRALLWNVPNGETFMDRIYGNDEVTQIFKNHAEDQGWWYKQRQSYEYPRALVNPQGEHVSKTFKIEVPFTPNMDSFPYMDTFKFLSFRNHTLSNSKTGADAELSSTNGEPQMFEHNIYDNTYCGTCGGWNIPPLGAEGREDLWNDYDGTKARLGCTVCADREARRNAAQLVS